MNTIQNKTIHEITIHKSRFITVFYQVKKKEDINKYLSATKNEFKDATHYCYAYIINEQKKSSDDNEPSGTAGIPILQVLEKNNLNYILAIVIRYFGGIKLGSGGLIRAYSKAIQTTLEQAKRFEIIKGLRIVINCNYQEQKELDYITKNYSVTKSFTDQISYIIDMPATDLNILNSYQYQIVKEIEIEQEKK